MIAERVEEKLRWVLERRREGVEGHFKAQALALPLPPSFHDALRCSAGDHAVILEVESGALTNGDVASVAAVAWESQVNALSVQADECQRRGAYADVVSAMQRTPLPILCRDLVVDPLQITMARAHGASAVVLSATVLDERDFRQLLRHATELGLDAVAEVTSATEIEMVRRIRLGPTETSSCRIYLVPDEDAAGESGFGSKLLPLIPDHAVRMIEVRATEARFGGVPLDAGADALLIRMDPMGRVEESLPAWLEQVGRAGG